MSTPTQNSPPSTSSNWLISHMKLSFFKRLRKFLQSKSKHKPRTQLMVDNELSQEAIIIEIDHHEDSSLVLQKSVKKLHFGSWEEKETAAMEIVRLAKKDVKARKLMGDLGVIPALVGMVAPEVASRRRQVAAKALIELANGSCKNKGLMLEAGILSKIPYNIDILDEPTRTKLAELVSTLSSLPNTQFPLSSTQVVPFFVGILDSSSSIESKEHCLAALYNLSSALENAGTLVSNGVVQSLLRQILVKELSEKALATLGHLVGTLMGKKQMENSSIEPESFIEVLTWEDKPKCQELSAYILMIMAHQSSAQRVKMANSGIVPVLLELALLGSPLAQKRALKLLQWFKDEGQTRMGPHSGPQARRVSMGSPISHRDVQEGRKLMKNLVKQSLYKNMEIITQRANAGGQSSKMKALVVSTSSKSLPY